MNIKIVIKYLAITFAITYVCWWGVAILVAHTHLKYGDVLPTIIYIIGNFGPAIAALFCLDGKNYFTRGYDYKVSYELKFTTENGDNHTYTHDKLSQNLNFLVTLLGSTFVYGGEEELGWRGVLQPGLSKKMTFPLAAIVCGAIWALWHLPLWFIEGHPNQSMPFWIQATLGIFLCFWLGIIYERSRCLPLCMLFHGYVNVLMSSFVLKLNFILIAGILLTTAAAIALWLIDIKIGRKINSDKQNFIEDDKR